jgi:hypothetical protein
MKDSTEGLRQVFGRFAAGFGLAAAGAAAFTGLSFVAGSAYLYGFLGRFHAEWALESASAAVRISSGWLVVAGLTVSCVLILGDAVQKLASQEVVSLVSRYSGLLACLAYLAKFLASLAFGDDTTNVAMGVQISLLSIVLCAVEIKMLMLTILSFQGLSKPNPFTSKALGKYISGSLMLGVVVFPWVLGHAWAVSGTRLNLLSLLLPRFMT